MKIIKPPTVNKNLPHSDVCGRFLVLWAMAILHRSVGSHYMKMFSTKICNFCHLCHIHLSISVLWVADCFFICHHLPSSATLRHGKVEPRHGSCGFRRLNKQFHGLEQTVQVPLLRLNSFGQYRHRIGRWQMFHLPPIICHP